MLWAPAKAQRQKEMGFLEEMESNQGDGAARAESGGREWSPLLLHQGRHSCSSPDRPYPPHGQTLLLQPFLVQFREETTLAQDDT